MTVNWDLVINFTIAMLAIVNPVEKIPLWVAASGGERRKFVWLLAALILLTCAVILLFFLLLGQQLLVWLKIELASFKIGGGLILLQFGFSMMRGTAIQVERQESGKREADLKSRVLQRYRQIFIPMGVPVIAGPGALTTVIIYGHQSDSAATSLFLSLTMIAVLFILFLTLMSGAFIQRRLGDLPLDLTSRVFGMILIAIAVQFMVAGLAETFPGWTRI